MPKYEIILKRGGTTGFLSNQSIGTDAHNAMSSIPGVENPEIVWEKDDRVKIIYTWTGKEKIWDLERYLSKHGLERADILQ